jgi:hypothetical protein
VSRFEKQNEIDMKIEIKHRYTNEVIYSCEAENIKEAVEKAVKENSNLENANLENANLGYANLENVNLENAKNLDKTIKLPMYCKWTHGITNGNLIHIGCEKRTIEEWDSFFNSDEKLSTERGTQEFKQIQAVFEAYKGYLNFLNK